MRQLLFSVTKKDLEVQTFRAGGKGGQNQNKRDTGVRIIHRDSGARGEARDERSQGQNKKLAFRRMVETKEFQTWLRVKAGLAAVEADEWLERMMRPENIRVEVKENGKWVEVPA